MLLPPFGCWCRSGELRARFRTKRFGLVQCSACGCFRIDPPPISSDVEGARFYRDYYAKNQSAKGTKTGGGRGDSTRESRFWKVVDYVPDLAYPRQRVADIGCGEGDLCAELKAAGWPAVVGYDISETRISRAREKHPDIEFHAGPFSTGIVPEKAFDLVIMDNVVEHLTDPPATVRTVARSLRTSGKVVLITPNMRSGQFRLLGRRWTAELAPHAHVFLFTAAVICRLVSMCGLVVQETGTFHLDRYPVQEILKEIRCGEYKEAAWHAMNEAGGLYARLIRSGPMLFAVAQPATES